MRATERTVSATHLRRDLGAVLDGVLSGVVVRVERNGRPLAVIVPPQLWDNANHEIEETTT